MTLADVQRVADEYLKPANRVLGEFHADRAARPRRDPAGAGRRRRSLKDYQRRRAACALGEAFDPSPKNIESRLQRQTLANGINAALLPKQTRGGRVVATLTLHWGDEKTLMNREVACDFAGADADARHQEAHARAELKEAFEKLNARVSSARDGASIEVRGENLMAALRLVAEALREPSFPPSEFEELKRARAHRRRRRSAPIPARTPTMRLSRHLEPYPVGHRNYTPTVEERIDWIKQDHARGRAEPAIASSSARPAPTSPRSASSTRQVLARAVERAVRRLEARRTRSRACRRATSIARRSRTTSPRPTRRTPCCAAGRT